MYELNTEGTRNSSHNLQYFLQQTVQQWWLLQKTSVFLYNVIGLNWIPDFMFHSLSKFSRQNFSGFYIDTSFQMLSYSFTHKETGPSHFSMMFLASSSY